MSKCPACGEPGALRTERGAICLICCGLVVTCKRPRCTAVLVVELTGPSARLCQACLPIVEGGPYCWKCMKRRVPNPHDLCARCTSREAEKVRRRLSDTRKTMTHERSHEKRQTPIDFTDGTGNLATASYRHWQEMNDEQRRRDWHDEHGWDALG